MTFIDWMFVGFVAVADRVRDFEQELLGSLQAERELARAQEELLTLDRRRGASLVHGLRRLISGDGL